VVRTRLGETLPTKTVTLGVPAYFYPWPDDPTWPMLAELPPGSIVVMTPDNGPGKAVDPQYRTALSYLTGTSTTLYGYVDSAYAARDPAVLLAEVETYVEWYGITGVFVDQVLATAPHRDAYEWLSARLRQRGLRVALNPGQPVIDPSYLDIADHVLVFEGTLTGYREASIPAWTADVDRDRLWHCVYEVDDETACREVLALAAQRNAGVVFATDGRMPNPWDRLPPYWTALLAAAKDAEPNG
jgi:hypothetical protein